MNPFLTRVEEAFRDLIARGYRVRSHSYEPEVFGDAAVILEDGSVVIRVVSDRGQIFVDIACKTAPEDWHPLQRVLRAVGSHGVPDEGPIELSEAASLLARNVAQLERAFGSNEYAATQATLRVLSDAAQQRYLDDLKKARGS